MKIQDDVLENVFFLSFTIFESLVIQPASSLLPISFHTLCYIYQNIKNGVSFRKRRQRENKTEAVSLLALNFKQYAGPPERTEDLGGNYPGLQKQWPREKRVPFWGGRNPFNPGHHVSFLEGLKFV